MSHLLTSLPSTIRIIVNVLCLTVSLTASITFSQTQQSNEDRQLPPSHTLEREMAGAETHRYRLELKANEFCQVRVEQKSIDVTLKLSDASGKVLATMNTPERREGREALSAIPETLSFVAEREGNYTLELSRSGEETGKGIYTIRRETRRTATVDDKRRVRVEQIFAAGAETLLGATDQERAAIAKFEEALRGWRELGDVEMADMTAQLVKTLNAWVVYKEVKASFDEAKVEKGADEFLRKAFAKAQLAVHLHRESGDKTGEAYSLHLAGFITGLMDEAAAAIQFYEQALSLCREIGDTSEQASVLNDIGLLYQDLGNHQKALYYLEQALSILRDSGDRSGEAGVLNNICLNYRELGCVDVKKLNCSTR